MGPELDSFPGNGWRDSLPIVPESPQGHIQSAPCDGQTVVSPVRIFATGEEVCQASSLLRSSSSGGGGNSSFGGRTLCSPRSAISSSIRNSMFHNSFLPNALFPDCTDFSGGCASLEDWLGYRSGDRQVDNDTDDEMVRIFLAEDYFGML